MYSPVDPAALSRTRRLLTRTASGLLGHFTRALWRHSRARRCTFDPDGLAERLWRWHRRVSRIPRQNPTPRRVRFAGGVHLELDLARLTDAMAFCYGLGESEVGLIFRRWARPGDTVLDVGGNIGTAALDFAAAAPESRVHVFEPAPEMLAALRHNLELNRLPNVEVHAFGLGERDERRWLQADMPHNPGSNYVAAAADSGICPVELRRLDGLTFLTAVSFIKIDVEGFELAVLRGGQDLIARCRPLLILERNDRALARAGASWGEVRRTLVRWGYELGAWHLGRWRAYPDEAKEPPALHNVIAAHPGNPRHAGFIRARH